MSIKKYQNKSIILGLILIVLTCYVFADTDGIWHKAEDIRGGIFGQDEQDVTTSYTFINDVHFNNKVIFNENIGIKIDPEVALHVNGKIKMVDETEDSDSDDTVVTKGYLDLKIFEKLKEFAFWEAQEWQDCSVECGGGTQTRDIICKISDKQVNNKYCEDLSKPIASQPCNTQSCVSCELYPGSTSSCTSVYTDYGSCGGYDGTTEYCYCRYYTPSLFSFSATSNQWNPYFTVVGGRCRGTSACQSLCAPNCGMPVYYCTDGSYYSLNNQCDGMC